MASLYSVIALIICFHTGVLLLVYVFQQNVTCQKCLQKGHWTYECKNSRKYVHRSSRSYELNKNMKQAKKRKLAIEVHTTEVIQ